MTEKVGFLLGEKVGDVLKVDVDEGKLIGGKWLCVRILVDVSKPLKTRMLAQSCDWGSLMGYLQVGKGP